MQEIMTSFGDCFVTSGIVPYASESSTEVIQEAVVNNPQYSEQLDVLNEFMLYLLQRIDFLIALIVTVAIVAVCYKILNSFAKI